MPSDNYLIFAAMAGVPTIHRRSAGMRGMEAGWSKKFAVALQCHHMNLIITAHIGRGEGLPYQR